MPNLPEEMAFAQGGPEPIEPRLKNYLEDVFSGRIAAEGLRGLADTLRNPSAEDLIGLVGMGGATKPFRASDDFRLRILNNETLQNQRLTREAQEMSERVRQMLQRNKEILKHK